jgi:hypothetical protein
LKSGKILCRQLWNPNARNSYVNATKHIGVFPSFPLVFWDGPHEALQKAAGSRVEFSPRLAVSLCRDDVGTNAARSARDCPGPVLPRRAQIAMGAEAICSRACAAAARILNVHD